ncbi:ectoine/hydroxyectoine ABC transporter permease subunit EhuC [Dongia deserti]|uniref:ectoine/hydroxyectoine ABC transporter permease subunit EhuC n=1 Tax=Dongia deserti TaxID=2268030 RepID=UPI000E6591B2|nr:ectoine/hydroxyectoine ABC transporter permease subunit EhuC [Dongia deserti]
MGMFSLSAMLVAALIAIAIMSLFGDNALFMSGLLQGAWLTVQITLLGSLLAVIMATTAALFRLYGAPPLRWLAVTYVEFFRGTSALVQLFWLFFVLPLFGISMDPFSVGVLGLGLNIGAYGAEVVRGAVQGVHRGQWEATTALNMTRWQALKRIILPQAFVAMIPPWGNLFIELLKSTALVSLITMSDLTFRAKTINDTTMQTIPIFTLALLTYLVMSLTITIGMRWLERASLRGMVRGRGR